MDKRPLQKHSKLSKKPRIQAFESLEAFKMYYAIGASVSSLHRESTDSLINMNDTAKQLAIALSYCILQEHTVGLVPSVLHIQYS